ncbi:MAG: DUF962 domain-containing protein [Candidatus Omnitrophica bacterium]|nr:DUF962 domain-containing protein [Candidatus Omnitrophota bacterium]
MTTVEKPANFKEFWPVYVMAHQNPVNRLFHFAATLTSILMSLFFAVTGKLIFLILTPVASYALAWAGHFLHEKNTPLTWTYPVYSLVADYKMFILMLLGKYVRR